MFKFLPILLFAYVFSHPPTVFDDEYTLDEDTQIYIDIYAIHSYGYNVLINIIDAPEHGILTITGGGGGDDMSMLEVLYAPNVDYNGYDSFTYNAVHDEFISEEAIISLTINSFNDVPYIGDLNDDGNIDVLDVIILVNHILSPATVELEGADINNDGQVNILDVVQLVNIILGITENTVSDIDGNIYEIIQIGDQLWMAENLKVTHFNNGDEIPTGYSASEWDTIHDDAYAVYDDDPANAEIYGNLYNYYAVDDSRGICPPNYHIPTDDEWYVLLEYLGGDSGENWIIAGGKMKDVGTIEDGDGMWYAPNEGANNESDFTVIPAGFRLNDGQYYENGYYGIFWSSTAEYYTNAFFMWYLLHDESRLYRGLFDSQTGLSVRCLAD